ncbi:MAG: cytochrome c biogenesis CcdA family protein [archaeon]
MDEYGYEGSVPYIYFSKDKFLAGDSEIIGKLEDEVNKLKTNNCLLPSKLSSAGLIEFSKLNINSLAGKPTIWTSGKVLFKNNDSNISNELLHQLLDGNSNIDLLLSNTNYHILKNTEVMMAGRKPYKYDNAVSLDGYSFYWNGITTITEDNCDINSDVNQSSCNNDDKTKGVTYGKAISLALVDAVNPCEFAVLITLLIAIMTSNPKNKKKVLLSGLSFALAIFILYFLYGLFLINIFKLIPQFGTIRIIISKVVALFAIILGLFQLRDYFDYKPGGFATEMPLSFRPKVKKLISKVTSPGGAFVVGIVVTLFLLPCTIGPYVILGDLLSFRSIVSSLPILLLYNIIFIMPMVLITLFVYFGLSKIENIAEWKEKNIKYLHLVAGIIIMALGILMLLGVI